MNFHSSKGQGGRLTPRDMALGEDSSLGRGASQNRPFMSADSLVRTHRAPRCWPREPTSWFLRAFILQ